MSQDNSISISKTFSLKPILVEPTEAHPRMHFILRPIIPIRIIGPKSSLKIEVLIDSGSDFCIFPASIGKEIGIVIKQGPSDEMLWCPESKKTHRKIIAYFHDINFEILGLAKQFPCYAGFSYEFDRMEHMSVMGVEGFFNHFAITFGFKKFEFEIKV